MTPDQLGLLTVIGIGKSVANSALPNAPVVDDSNDPPSIGQRLTSARKRLAAVIWPGELNVPSFEQQPATIPGC
jgi:hypothetical protein